MPVEIEGIRYLTTSDLEDELGVSRQTLWRWRQDGKVPSGHRFRGRQVIFAPEEASEVRSYANRIEPIDESARDQLKLFDSVPVRRSGGRND